MKRIILLSIILFSAAAAIAQQPFYGYYGTPYCWDSSGVSVQTYKQILHTSNKLPGTYYALYNERGQVVIGYNESDLSAGYCGEINRVGLDTIENVTCLLLTRQMTNTVNSTTLYPKHELEKRTYTVGSQIVDTKYYIPNSNQLVASPLISISTMGCEDFYALDFTQAISHGDTITATAGDTVIIDTSITGNPTRFSISCDNTTINYVKLDISYAGVIIDGGTITPTGNGSAVLFSGTNAYYEKWDNVRISTVSLIADVDCLCSYRYSHEFSKF